MERRECMTFGLRAAVLAPMVAWAGRGDRAAAQEMRSIARKRVRTNDGVDLSVIDIGDPTKPALVFVHGLSQSALAWQAQLASSELRARFRLIAVDLRGHGQSQGAFGAMTDDGRTLSPLAGHHYAVPGDRVATSRLWSHDIDAVIDGLSLRSPILVGWSYGAVVIADYITAHGGLGAAHKVLLTGGTPVLLPPGTPDGGAEQIFAAAVPPAVFKTLDQNLLSNPVVSSSYGNVVAGLSEFVELALSDRISGRPAASRDEIIAAAAYNVLLPPAARQAIVSRDVDHRPVLRALPQSDKKRILILSGSADAVIQSANTAEHYRRCGLEVDIIADEGHGLFIRNPSLFESRLLAFLGA